MVDAFSTLSASWRFLSFPTNICLPYIKNTYLCTIYQRNTPGSTVSTPPPPLSPYINLRSQKHAMRPGYTVVVLWITFQAPRSSLRPRMPLIFFLLQDLRLKKTLQVAVALKEQLGKEKKFRSTKIRAETYWR